MRSDFVAFILTHGRPDRVYTYDSLMKAGYTGRVYLVVDDEDKTAPRYVEKYGADAVLRFSKAEIAARFDEGDNFGDRRAIIYARNACWDLAEQVGAAYFMQLDDDYSGFYFRNGLNGRYANARLKSTFDAMIDALIEFYRATPCLSIAISQGGDHIGGHSEPRLKRKAMNSFLCSVDRRFWFNGRINEDVNTYTGAARRGALFFTVTAAQLNQKATQSNAGGMTDLYLDSGTYVKSFYSVIYCPSSVKISELGDHRSPHYRIHHSINWTATAPKIVREELRRSSG